jgi:hypothetical protein
MPIQDKCMDLHHSHHTEKANQEHVCCIKQSSPLKQPVGSIQTHNREFIVGIGSHDLGDQEVPQHALWRIRKGRGLTPGPRPMA